MSYTLTISGHKVTGTPEEAQAFEEDVVSKAKAFVAGLEGVTAAYANTGSGGQVSLQEAAA